MQFIETALAFAITMLVLSMVVSTFVELVHRAFSMREEGLKHMLAQLFDQVLSKYLKPEDVAKLVENSKIPAAAKGDAAALLGIARNEFVERMSANRAPMGAVPKATLDGATPTNPARAPVTAPAESAGTVEKLRSKLQLWMAKLHLWNGRDLAAMTPDEFMERLGSIDTGAIIKKANADANKAASDAAKAAGGAVADAADAVLKGVAQKFEAFGKEAGDYFEGRARLLSVLVAVVFALVVHVDAIDLFKTFLRDPNVRAKVIEQTQAVTAQQKAAQDKLDATNKAPPPSTNEDVEKLKKDLQAAIDDTKKTTAQLSDLGVPIGWKDTDTDTLNPFKKLPFCIKDGTPDRPVPVDVKCDKEKGETRKTVGFGATTSLFLSLLLGGFLVGLGSPFWYSAVTGLTNIRSVAGKATGSSTQSQAAAAAADAVNPADADKAQPVTPVGTFEVSNAALDAQPQPKALTPT